MLTLHQHTVFLNDFLNDVYVCICICYLHTGACRIQKNVTLKLELQAAGRLPKWTPEEQEAPAHHLGLPWHSFDCASEGSKA